MPRAHCGMVAPQRERDLPSNFGVAIDKLLQPAFARDAGRRGRGRDLPHTPQEPPGFEAGRKLKSVGIAAEQGLALVCKPTN